MAYADRDYAQTSHAGTGRPIAMASSQEKLAFFRKVFGLFSLGFLVLAIFGLVGMFVFRNYVPIGMWNGSMIGLIIVQAGITWFGMNSLRSQESQTVLFFLYAAISGIVLGPMLLYAALVGLKTGVGQWGIAAQALGMTAACFGGLTAYVFTTKKDFSYLGGALAIIGMAIMGFVVLSWIGVFQLGSTMSMVFAGGMVVYSAACVLYTTSKMIHYYDESHTIMAAFELLASFFIMFWYILQLFLFSSE